MHTSWHPCSLSYRYISVLFKSTALSLENGYKPVEIDLNAVIWISLSRSCANLGNAKMGLFSMKLNVLKGLWLELKGNFEIVSCPYMKREQNLYQKREERTIYWPVGFSLFQIRVFHPSSLQFKLKGLNPRHHHQSWLAYQYTGLQ